MNGGFNDELYYSIDSMRCAKQKTLAFENLRAEHLFTSIGMIVVRGINESAVAPLWDASLSARNVREFHLRSVGAIGRYMETKSLDLDELLDVFCAAAGVPAASIDTRQRTASSHDFRFGRLRVQLTQWPDLGSLTRGRLTQDGMIAPAFEHKLENEWGY
jgi:hypothetical protein